MSDPVQEARIDAPQIAESSPVRNPGRTDTAPKPASIELQPAKYSNQWWKKFWWEQIWPLVLLLAALFSVRSAIADWNVVPTGSMKPTIIEGDRIFVNKLAYDLKIPFTTIHLAKWSDPKRGEIVVFASPRDGTRLVKRVIGVPGDTVQLIKNRVYINGKPSEYTALDQDTEDQVNAYERESEQLEFYTENLRGVSHAMMQKGTADHRYYPATTPPIVVPPGQYFVMGDNRDYSADSRFFGQKPGDPDPSWIRFVPRDNIVGRSSRVILSLNYDNYYLPRSERFFRALP